MGKKVTLAVDTYISEMQVYLDGELIFSRGDNQSKLQAFLPIQAIPLTFTVSKKKHHIAIRVKTILMKGIYQFPFNLRQYKKNDWFLTLIKFFTHDIRIASSALYISFGLLFLFLYFQLKQTLYLFCAITGMAAFPFFGLPAEAFLDALGWQEAMTLHYIGLVYVPLIYFYLASDFKFSVFNLGSILFYVATFFNFIFIFLAYMPTFNHELFLIIRKLDFLVALLVGLYALILCFKAYYQGKLSLSVVMGLLFFFLTAFHDVLLSLGFINSILLIHFGLMVSMIILIQHVTVFFASAEKDKDKYLAELVNLNNTLEAKVKRTSALEDANNRMTTLAHNAGMAEIATGVLHDIGNILTSASIVSEKIERKVKKSKLSSLNKFIDYAFDKNKEKSASALGEDVPKAFLILKKELSSENDDLLQLSDKLGTSIESIKNILLSQQQYAKTGGLVESVDVKELISDIIKIESNRLERFRVSIINNVVFDLNLNVHKNKLFHVFINLIKNAIEALIENDIDDRSIIIYQEEATPHIVRFKDNGVGIESEKLKMIFTHGHTTKKDGHGFGLHASFNSMTEMGGSLAVESEALGKRRHIYSDSSNQIKTYKEVKMQEQCPCQSGSLFSRMLCTHPRW